MQVKLSKSLINTINITTPKDLMNSICLPITFASSLHPAGYFILFCRRLVKLSTNNILPSLGTKRKSKAMRRELLCV